MSGRDRRLTHHTLRAHQDTGNAAEVVAESICLAELIERIDQLATAARHSGGLSCMDHGVTCAQRLYGDPLAP